MCFPDNFRQSCVFCKFSSHTNKKSDKRFKYFDKIGSIISFSTNEQCNVQHDDTPFLLHDNDQSPSFRLVK